MPFLLHGLDTLAVDFEQVIVPVVIFFLVVCFLPCLLTRYRFVSCQQHMCHRFCLLCIYGVLGDFEQVIVPVLLYLALFVDQALICSMSTALVYIGVILQYNSGSMGAIFKKSPFTFIFHLGTVYLHHFR